MMPKIAIIGAGWAGLAAAATLCSTAQVTVFEASKQAGGRARGLKLRGEFTHVDNGQHLILSAYQQVFRLRRLCGLQDAEQTVHLPSQWRLVDGLDFKTRRLPAPWHVLLGMLAAKNWRFSEKKRWLQDAYALQRADAWLDAHDVSVLSWLTQRQTPDKLIVEFWQPLVLATMNTPLAQASLNTLAAVLKDGLLRRRQDSDFCLPTVDLSTWFVEPLTAYLRQHGVGFQYQQRIQNLEKAADGRHWLIHGESFDKVIVATAPYHVLDVLGDTYATSIKSYFDALTYSAITTVYLRYPQALPLQHTIQGSAYGASQWLIQREPLGFGRHEVAAVISVSESHGSMSQEDWVRVVHQDLCRLQDDLPEPIASQVITEKRATVHSVVNKALPPVTALNKQGLYLAGDYCHPRYPATLEAAVQSGQMTAAMCMADWKNT